MAHFNHWRELETNVVREAIRRLRDAGAVIRCQAPLLRHINDSSDVWIRMWEEEVRLGMIPYYMFVERDTGARNYFEGAAGAGLPHLPERLQVRLRPGPHRARPEHERYPGQGGGPGRAGARLARRSSSCASCRDGIPTGSAGRSTQPTTRKSRGSTGCGPPSARRSSSTPTTSTPWFREGGRQRITEPARIAPTLWLVQAGESATLTLAAVVKSQAAPALFANRVNQDRRVGRGPPVSSRGFVRVA